MCNPALRSEILPIVTPLHWGKWWDRLKEASILGDFYDVPQGLCSGFNVGVHEALTSTFTPPNSASGVENYDIIDTYYASEEAAGRVSRLFDPAVLQSLIGHFHTSPMGVFFRSPTSKPQIVQDHSFPRNHPSLLSVNSQISSSDFHCDWYSFHDCYQLVAAAPPRTQAVVFDVDAAFRRVPLAPEDHPFMCILLKNGTIRIDHVFCFSGTSGPRVFSHVADAIVAIYYFARIEALLKWVDDFIFFRYAHYDSTRSSWSYLYNAQLIWNIARYLGWPWALAKFIDFSSVFPYVGFMWDMEEKVVYLTAEKCAKFVARLEPWTSGGLVTHHDCQVVLGTLNHCALILPDSRSHLPSLFRLCGSFGQSHYMTKHRITTTVANDIAWWRIRLSAPWCELWIKPIPDPSPFKIHVDASTSWGIRFMWKGQWLAWKLKAGWKGDGRDIGWAEMVAVELVLITLVAAGIYSAHLILRSDNSGVCGTMAAGKSCNPTQNDILRHTVELLRDSELTVTVNWISTNENLADTPSRGKLSPKATIFTPLPKVPFHLKKWVEKPVRAETYAQYAN